MILGALDMEFGFHGRPFDYGTVEPVCGVLLLADGKRVAACPRLGLPWSLLLPLLLNVEILVSMHHGAYAERRVLEHLNLPFPEGHWWDTELAERVLHIAGRGDLAQDRPVKGDGPYTLLACLRRRGYDVRDADRKKGLQEKIGKLEFSDSDLPEIVKYCADDCADTLRLAQEQVGGFQRLPGRMTEMYVGLLQPHLLRVADMTAKGLAFDTGSYAMLRNNGDRLRRACRPS